MFRRICEKSVPVDKQHILNFYNSKETIKNLLVKIGGTSPKDAEHFANKAIGNVHFLNKQLALLPLNGPYYIPPRGGTALNRAPAKELTTLSREPQSRGAARRSYDAKRD